MADKLLICVNAEQSMVSVSHNGKLGACQSFRNDDEGTQSFDRFVAGLKSMPALVMVDVIEEDYRFELLPHATGRDRAELVSRRLRQLYRNTAFCSSWAQGRDSGKRRDDQYLFFALTNPDIVNGWLGILRAHELPVVGVFLLPIVAQALAQKLAPATTNLLLVSSHVSGIRLTFFRQGNLRISRLTRVEIADSRGRAAYTEEIANTRLYLHALRVMTLDEHMNVLILDRDGSLAGLEQSVAREVSNAQATLLTVADIVGGTGVPEAIVRDVPDALYLHFLGQHPPLGNLAPEPITERFQIYQLRRALYATAGIIGTFTFAWAATNFYRIYDLRSQQALAASQTAEQQRRYQEVTRGFPAIPTSADNLVHTVQVAEQLKTAKRNPEPAMIALSRALERFPSVWLKGFGWKYAVRDFDTGGTTRSGNTASTATPAATGARSLRRQSAYVEAEIRPFAGDYRRALDEIASFAETLQQDPVIADVEVVELPLNVSPTMALSGSTTEATIRATSAPFKLNVSFKADL
jgi:hypothetical protein